MAEEINIEDYKYNVRDVAQKQVYDSYMGILRISPNNGEDDPTSLLETEGRDIKLSDSNGHELPITFASQSFDDGWFYVKTKTSDNVYVSKSFTSRSTLLLTDETSNTKSRIIIFDDLQDKTTNGILMYPNKRPSSNDTSYFNLNDKHDFWKEENKKWVTDEERYKLVEKGLLGKNLDWYNKNVEDGEKVKIGGTYLTQTNNFGEEVPILYTHDYILGTSATGTTTNTLPTLDESTHVTELTGNCTQLSWERIDDLIWQKLKDFLDYRDDINNNVVGLANRFTDLSLFTGETSFSSKSALTLSGESTSDAPEYQWRLNAPLLARGVQDGLIMYHAMPFNRYWFHRCRQVLTNMEISDPVWAAIDIKKKAVQFPKWSDMDDTEKQQLSQAKWDGLITAASKATLTPHHSLVKDYLLCNGKEITVKSFPNINLKNYKFFDIEQKGAYATKNTSTNKYNVIDYSSITDDEESPHNKTTHYAVFKSLSSKKLPDLFNFENLSPRFIRGLNFAFNGDYIAAAASTDFDDFLDTKLIDSSSDYAMSYCDDDQECTIQKIKDVFGRTKKFFNKDIKTITFKNNEPHPSSFDYLDRKYKHYHLLFSSDSSERDGINDFVIGKTKKSNEGNYALEEISFDDSTSVYSNENTNPKLRGILRPWLEDIITKEINEELALEKKKKDAAVLFKNVNGAGQLPDDWIDYCLCKYKGKFENKFYSNFQPIPTVGLFFNSAVDSVDGKGNTYDFTNYYYYDAEGTQHHIGKLNKSAGEKLNQLKIKMNESEGIWPISVAGKASFKMIHYHTWQRKRTTTFKKRWDWENGELHKNDVSKYCFHGINAANYDWETETYSPAKDENGNYYFWRTVTSLPLTNCEKLGCGDLTDYNPDVDKAEKLPNDPDYYTYHNVTDQWRETKSFKKDNIYPGTAEMKTTDNSPYPSHINLLPLIKL